MTSNAGEYHKIQTVFKRDEKTSYKSLLEGQYSIPEFEYLKDNRWIFTEKVDGTNIRVIVEEDKISFKGKSKDSQMRQDLLKSLQNIFTFEREHLIRALFKDVFQPEKDEKVLRPFKNVCLYGEGYGPKIQKGGGKYRKDQSFVLFDIRCNGWWLKREDLEEIAHLLKIDLVPIIGRGTLSDMVDIAKRGIISTWGDFDAEGIVAKPEIELKTRSGHRIITKVKTKDFIV